MIIKNNLNMGNKGTIIAMRKTCEYNLQMNLNEWVETIDYMCYK